MDIDLSQYMGMYIDGSKENLDMMDKMLLALEQDPGNAEAVGEIFRAAHTLKGMSATMGFEKVAHLTHEMENILDKLRNKQLSVTQPVIDVLFETFDVLRLLVNDTISATDSDVNLGAITKKLADVVSGGGDKRYDRVATVSASATEQTSASGGSEPASGGEASDLVFNEFELQVLLEAQGRGAGTFIMKVSLVPDCILKAPRAFMVVRNLEELGCEIIKSIPDTKDLEQEKFDLSFKMILVSPSSAADVRNAIESISEIESVNVESFKPENVKPVSSVSTPATVPVVPPRPPPKAEPTHLRQKPPAVVAPTPSLSSPIPAHVSAPAVNVVHPSPVPASAPLVSMVPPSPPPPPALPPAAPSIATGSAATAGGGKAAAAEKRGSQTVRVDMRRLDELMNLVGELVINRTRLADIGAAHRLKDLNETLARVSQISSSLQSVVMQVRMVPVEQVFDRFPRMVRDLAKKLGKKIDLVLEGKDTEMDRTVIDEIGDPMVHLIRNSIDHGIESPADRAKAGKPETGIISLIARHEGNHVIIEVRDDGKGIDPRIVGPLAVKKGLFTQEQIDKMPPEEIVKIVFMPGFSTAIVVSDLSGRGVGMDAVKNKLDELNGSIDVESKVGEGSRVIIKLPLTLAILQALMVKLGNETYAIPLGSVQETMDITAAEINIVQHQEVTLLREDVLPIIRLRHVLNVPNLPDEKEKTEEISIVVCSSGEKRAGFMVDELLGQQEIVIKSLGNLLSGLPGIMGATMRGDGSIALILDIPSFFQMRGQAMN
ncbi:MAG: chemotaxis protein CheA [Candidatus Riflebacteria bacterium]|nr:chemotaxis protein CheA [Candidatus Riflebacteria bacterium]